MKVRFFSPGRIFMGRLQHGADLLEDVLKFAQDNKVETASFTAIGALRRAVVAYYDQTGKRYGETVWEKPLEVLSCNGNISLKDGRPFIHAHVVLSDEEGRAFGGHLQPGSLIFAGEIVLRELLGEALVREYDEVTGLNLWKL